MSKKAIIIGATSGIGESLARLLSSQGYTLGLTGRRLHLLQQIKGQLNGQVFVREMDVSNKAQTQQQFDALVSEMGAIDLVVISAGIGHVNPELDCSLETQTIDTNVTGFVIIANLAYKHFQQRGTGQIVGISSIAALRGGGDGPAYNASKAFMSNYLEGLRIRAFKNRLDIIVTDVRPGFVDTQMAQGDGVFWVAPPLKAAEQIMKAIEGKKSVVYITKRWRSIAWLMKVLPFSIYKKL